MTKAGSDRSFFRQILTVFVLMFTLLAAVALLGQRPQVARAQLVEPPEIADLPPELAQLTLINGLRFDVRVMVRARGWRYVLAEALEVDEVEVTTFEALRGDFMALALGGVRSNIRPDTEILRQGYRYCVMILDRQGNGRPAVYVRRLGPVAADRIPDRGDPECLALAKANGWLPGGNTDPDPVEPEPPVPGEPTEVPPREPTPVPPAPGEPTEVPPSEPTPVPPATELPTKVPPPEPTPVPPATEVPTKVPPPEPTPVPPATEVPTRVPPPEPTPVPPVPPIEPPEPPIEP